MTTRTAVTEWLAEYERAWRTAGTGGLDRLFTDDATYQMDPYEPPFEGLHRIATIWERERDGPDEPFTMEREIVAVDGDTAVVRLEVRYDDPPRQYRDLWTSSSTRPGAAARSRSGRSGRNGHAWTQTQRRSSARWPSRRIGCSKCQPAASSRPAAPSIRR
jgi:ketosteroid isomerase-like protein